MPDNCNDFNNIPYSCACGKWYNGDNLVTNAPSNRDGVFIKIGYLIIASDWEQQFYLKMSWGIVWKDWKKIN